MKNTPLLDKHLALNAKMVPFAGYNMPVSYSGIIEEHQRVRQALGIFDVSHMGEFIVRGTKALDLVQKLISNDASRLAIGDAQYACFPRPEGGIVDDLLVYRLPEDMCSAGEQAFMLVVNASNMDKDWNWIAENNPFSPEEVRLINISEQTALMAVQGPKATEALQSLTDVDLSSLKYYTFAKGRFAGVDNVLISATGYTGAGGFELYVANEAAGQVWDAVMQAGQAYGILPIGLGARDTLRLEMGFCLYGNDIDDTTSALEAGLGWITKLNKTTPFLGQEFLQTQKAQGLERKLVGFQVEDKRPARQGYTIANAQGEAIGRVTSGTKSPSLEHPIGLGYVQSAYAQPGTPIFLELRGQLIPAKVCKLPFYNKPN